MEVTTSCGTLFVIPDVEKKEVKEISPCQFLAMLLTENRGLAWETFNRENIVEVVNGAVKGHPLLARKLLPPFDFENRIFQVSKDWKHIEKVLQYPLPALPIPSIVKLPRDAHVPDYQHAGRSYRLPQANGFIFGSEGLDFNHFLRIWIYLNKRDMNDIYVKEVQAALRSLALQGFPEAHKLAKSWLKKFDLSDDRKMTEQHCSKVWLDLKVNRPEESLGIFALKKTQALSIGPATLSADFTGKLGSVTSTPHRNQAQKTHSMSKLQLELLRSENRFLSITTLVPKSRGQAANAKAELDAVYDIQRRAGVGFVGAVWYGRELIVEFVTREQRDSALSSMIEDLSPLVKKKIGSIGSGEAGDSKLYMSWVLPYYPRDTPATLSSALDDHFDGTGYSSFYTFGKFDRPEGRIRIIFHNAPPALKQILESHCFQERCFWVETVTDSDYPLQKPSVMQTEIKANADIGIAKGLADDNDTKKESLGAAVGISDVEATYSLQTEQALNESESNMSQTMQAKQEVNAKIEPVEKPANDSAKRFKVSLAKHSAKETKVNADNDATEGQANESEKIAEPSAAVEVIRPLTRLE